MVATMYIGGQTMRLSNFRGSISWATHSGDQTLRGRSETFRGVNNRHQIPPLCPSIPNIAPLQLQCTFSTNEASPSPFYRLGVNQLNPSFTSERGTSPLSTSALVERERPRVLTTQHPPAANLTETLGWGSVGAWRIAPSAETYWFNRNS